MTGGLRIHLTDRLEWNPAVAGGFGTYERILTETIGTLIQSALGADVVRDIAYDIMLGTVGPERPPA
ncbi:hypothetical protein BJF79_05735 [Actinomadura sp. CNU-125]|uniref:hypothetical protein n=1 Tax=Actinomadura sp. CNU-125 TaxID=1904961 RepID=UPI0009607BA4|nr:hypothetical protein [Actinomadura sp. CNU-125]OLT37713.1 hypothetical protein BJF79_05735 [Actinomadura sp. CNU-125]